MKSGLERKQSIQKKFPGFIQFVVLLSLLPVIYDGAIFELFGTIDLSFRYLPLGSIEDNRSFLTNPVAFYSSQEHESYMLPFVAMGLLYPIAVILGLLKRRWGWLIFGLALAHVVTALTVQELLASNSLPDKDMWQRYLSEYIQPASYVSLAWFLMCGRLWSKSFFVFVLLCLAMHMGFTSVSQNESAFQILFAPLLILFMLSVVGKAVYWGVFQNLYLFKRVGMFRTLWVGLKASFYWSPLLVLVIAPLLIASLWLHIIMEKGLYRMTWAYDDFLTNEEARQKREAKTVEEILDLRDEIDRKNSEIAEWTRNIKEYSALLKRHNAASAALAPRYWNMLNEAKNRKNALRAQENALAAAKQVAEAHYLSLQKLKAQFANFRRTRTSDGETAYFLVQTKEGLSHNPELDLPWSANILLSTYHMAVSERLLALEYYLVSLGAKSITEETVEAVAAQFDQIMPENLGMQGKTYDGFMGAAKTWGSNESAEMVEDGYKKIRKRTRANLLSKVRNLMSQNVEPTFDQRRDQLVEVVDTARNQASDIFYSSNRAAQYGVIWGYRWWTFSELFGTLLFIFVCIRSYLYVLGRVAFDSSQKIYISLEDVHVDKPDLPKSKVSVFDKEYGLKADAPETYYFSRKFEPHGYPPKFSVPQPTSAPIGRLLNGCMALNKISIDQSADRVFFTGQKSEHFVEWLLEPGESAVFDYRNFVGMSDSIKLSVHISLRVSSLMLDKVIYPIATGPGKLILCTEGVPHFGDDEHTRSSMPANRLVAWQKGLRFHSESELNFIDIYFSDSYVKKSGEGVLIMDADKRGAAKNGLTRFIKHFFLP